MTLKKFSYPLLIAGLLFFAGCEESGAQVEGGGPESGVIAPDYVQEHKEVCRNLSAKYGENLKVVSGKVSFSSFYSEGPDCFDECGPEGRQLKFIAILNSLPDGTAEVDEFSLDSPNRRAEFYHERGLLMAKNESYIFCAKGPLKTASGKTLFKLFDDTSIKKISNLVKLNSSQNTER